MSNLATNNVVSLDAWRMRTTCLGGCCASDLVGTSGGDINALLKVLVDYPSGPVMNCGCVVNILAACWLNFSGSEAERMQPDKLLGRVEDLCWNAPLLTFKLERHGGLVKGSSRAALHFWEVDLIKLSARITRQGYRQVKKRRSPMNTHVIATQAVADVLSGTTCPGLKVLRDGRFKIVANYYVPDHVPQRTLSGRRSRFRDDLAWVARQNGLLQHSDYVFSRDVVM